MLSAGGGEAQSTRTRQDGSCGQRTLDGEEREHLHRSGRHLQRALRGKCEQLSQARVTPFSLQQIFELPLQISDLGGKSGVCCCDGSGTVSGLARGVEDRFELTGSPDRQARYINIRLQRVQATRGMLAAATKDRDWNLREADHGAIRAVQRVASGSPR